MSFQATRWALAQRDLKPATKMVLMALAERHNPDFGCFPSHACLAQDAGMSERSVRNHLALLDELGLIRRSRGAGGMRKRRSTRYVLGFEDGFEQTPIADPAPCEQCPAAKKSAANLRESRRQILPTNPVRENLKEEGARAARSDPDDDFEKITEALGVDLSSSKAAWWRDPSARRHVAGWRKRYGLTGSDILEVARTTRLRHPEAPDGPKALDRAMERAARAKRSTDGTAKRRRTEKMPDPDAAAKAARFYAERLKAGQFIAPRSISPAIAQIMVAAGLAAQSEIRPEWMAA